MSNGKNQTSFNLSDLHSALATTSPGLSAEDRAGLMSAVQEKIQKLAGNRLEALSPKVLKRVEALMEMQNQHNEFEAKYFEERAALHAKYQKLYEPLYTKRYEIVNGVIEVEGIAEETLPKGKTSEEKGVPDFWLTAMNNHEVLTEEIQEGDEEALKFLRDIKCSKLDDTKGFKLEFFFDPNPYFKNSVLTKAYHMIDEDEPLLEKAIGTEIEWYPGKCLTQKVVIKKPRKGSRNTNPIKKMEKCESVFNFFSPPLVPESAADIDEDAAERLQGLMEQDYEIGSTIRDKIIPHAVSWFTGEAAEGDDPDDIELEDIDEEDSEEEDDDDDEADDEDEEDEDEDDDEDEEVGKSKEPKRRQKKSGGGEDQLLDRPAECKQQ